MKDTFAGRVRKAAASFPRGKSFTAGELSDRAGIQVRADIKRMHAAIVDLARAGEIERVRKGVYLYLGKPKVRPQKQKIMWEYFRMRKQCGATVTADELAMVAQASRDYAREWLTLLIKMHVVKDLGDGRFQLVKDTVEMPKNDAKAKRLRRLRQNRAAVRELLDGVCVAIAQASDLIERMEKDEERILDF